MTFIEGQKGEGQGPFGQKGLDSDEEKKGWFISSSAVKWKLVCPSFHSSFVNFSQLGFSRNSLQSQA